MCIHITGFDERFCSYCLEKKSPKPSKRAVAAAEKFLDVRSVNSDVYGTDWSEDECFILYAELEAAKTRFEIKKGITRVMKAILRTRRSVMWHYKHMFLIENDPRAGKTLLVFKRAMALK